MAILHLEDNPITRGKLADLLGMEDNRVEGHEYVATDLVPVVERRLQQGDVAALVLDLSLDPWSLNPQNMARVLLRLIRDKQKLEPGDEEIFHAYRLAALAHARGVPSALLTNWQDYLNPAKGITAEALREVFHADALFGKGDLGPCADWVRTKL